MMQLILYLIFVLPLVCATRIDVKECPLKKAEWETRERAFVHECKPPEVYHCIPDGNDDLMETCMIPFHVDPSHRGGCPWALYTDSGKTYLGGPFNPCSGPGCPRKDDPKYWTNKLYKYPVCLHHYVQTNIKTTEALTSTTWLENIIVSTPKRDGSTDHSSTVIGVLAGGVGVGLIIMAIWYYRKRRKSLTNSNYKSVNVELYETASLLQSDKNSNPTHSSVSFKVDETSSNPHQKKAEDFSKSEVCKSTEDNCSAELHSLCQRGNLYKVKQLIHKTKKGTILKNNDGQSLLHSAGISGSVDLVELLIDNGYDVRSQDNDGRTVVHIACMKGHVNLIKYLVYKDKDLLNIKDNDGMTPFHCVGFSDSIDLVKYLINKGCEVFSKVNDGRTIVHYACQEGHINVVKYLIDISKGVLNIKDKNGLTPFLCSGISGSVELAQYLSGKGCDTYSKDNAGWGIVHYACLKGHVNLVKHLIDTNKGVLHVKGNDGLTPFHCAGFSGSIELVQHLIDNGCDVCSSENGGRTIVHIACEKGHVKLVKHLIDKDKHVLNIKDKNGLTPFQCAGFSGSLDLVKFLMDNGCDVCSKSNDGETIVHNACNKGHLDLVKHLITRDKGLLNIKDNTGMTPFHHAGFSGSVELVQYMYLIDPGCDVNSKSDNGRTIVHNACYKGHVNLVKYFVNKDIGVFNMKDNEGLTMFHCAGLSGSVELVQYLMDKGCDVYSKDNGGWTIVHNACEKGHVNLVKHLIDRNKDVLNIKDNNGSTPFHCAGFSGSVELVHCLIDNNCDVYSKDNTGQTIVHNACQDGHISLVEFLIDKDKDVLNIRDNNGLTPFHFAGFSGSVELVQYLIDNGCDVCSTSNAGCTIVHYACQDGHVNLVKHLLDKNKGILNIRDNNGFTLFYRAGFSGSVELVKYLIDNGCDVYSMSHSGRTIVHYACEKGHVELVKHLVDRDKGVVNIKDKNGITPFHCAGFSGSVKLVKYLIDNGCDVYSKDSSGRSIVYNACYKGHVNLVKYLIDKDKSLLSLFKDNNGMTPFQSAGSSRSVELELYLMEFGFDV